MARRYRQVGLRAALDYRLGRTPALAARPVNVGARALNRPVGNYRADGKVLKGENYFRPDIAAVLEG